MAVIEPNAEPAADFLVDGAGRLLVDGNGNSIISLASKSTSRPAESENDNQLLAAPKRVI
jgi:hypothetical protein